MIVQGENFLRSNFVGGDPLRSTASAKQQNTVANVLKNIQGLGCRIEKPTDQRGKNWAIIIDGSSDLPLPDGVAPFGADQFQITQTSDDEILVRAGVWPYCERAGGAPQTPVVQSGGATSIQWTTTSNFNDQSDAYTITASSHLWLKLDRESSGALAAPVLTCEVIAAGSSPPSGSLHVDWRKIGEVDFAAGAITAIRQASDDCPQEVHVAAAAVSMLSSGTRTTAGVVDFDSNAFADTNTLFLDSDTTTDRVDINADGIYRVSLQGTLTATSQADSVFSGVEAYVRKNGTNINYCSIGCTATWSENDHDHSGSATNQTADIVDEMAVSHVGSTSVLVSLSDGDYLDAYLYKYGTGTIEGKWFDISVELVHAT